MFDVIDLMTAEAHASRLAMQITPSSDITANYHRGNPESVQANEIIQPKKSALRNEIYNWITSRGRNGATCYEVEQGLRLKHQTASARMSEMKLPDADYRIFWNGQKRSTGSATAKVYVTSEGQRA